MRYALMSEITFSANDKRNAVAKGIKERITGKPLWADNKNPTTVAYGKDENNKPILGIVLRFDNKDDRDEVALFLEDLILRVPALSGEVRVHKCYHDQPHLGKSCEPEEI